jgi:hypothetical protein
MTLDDARSFWQSQEPALGSTMQDSDILRLVQDRSREFDAKVRRRDIREIVAMVIVVLIMIPTLLRPLWLMRSGAAVILAGCALTYYKLTRARHAHPAPSAATPLVARLKAELAKVDAQIDLLDNVLWWYIAPFAIGPILIVASTAGATWTTVAYAIAVLLLAVIIYRINRRAVDRDLRPEHDKLSMLLQQAVE